MFFILNLYEGNVFFVYNEVKRKTTYVESGKAEQKAF